MRILEREVTTPVSDVGIIAAILLKSQACFGSLMFCRGLGGGFDAEEWYLARTYTLKELVAEADERGITLDGSLLTPVEKQPLVDSMKYKHARGLITDAELETWWRDVKAGRITV